LEVVRARTREGGIAAVADEQVAQLATVEDVVAGPAHELVASGVGLAALVAGERVGRRVADTDVVEPARSVLVVSAMRGCDGREDEHGCGHDGGDGAEASDLGHLRPSFLLPERRSGHSF
jgi:hypothetical protein